MGVSSRVRVLAVAGSAALGIGLLTAGSAQAVTTTTVDTVTYSSTALAVSGLELKPLTVSAHITSTATPHQWQFVMTASGGSGKVRWIQVIPDQSSGSFGDGVWTATVQVPSTADGTWSLAIVNDCSMVGPTKSCDDFTQTHVPGAPTFTVTGAHQPRVTWMQTPTTVVFPQTAGTVSGRVVDSETGLGMAGIPVGFTTSIDVEGWCTSGEFQATRTTTATGSFTFSTNHLAGLFHCMGVGTAAFESDGELSMPWYQFFEASTRGRLTASASTHRARVGVAVRVAGTYADAGGVLASVGKSVRIEQQVGHGWRQVGSAPVRASGRWTTTVRPLTTGRNVFRALYWGYIPLNLRPTSTRPFVITGT